MLMSTGIQTCYGFLYEILIYLEITLRNGLHFVNQGLKIRFHMDNWT